MKLQVLVVVGSAVLISAVAAASDPDYRAGHSAYGDWRGDSPGVLRKIVDEDIESPLATPPLANRSKIVPRPGDAQLRTMPGFTVTPLATGLTGARVVRVAPNGDLFVAQSRPLGQISVVRLARGGGTVERVATFAKGLKDAYGIAFYPPGPDPQWVYVGMEGKVVRFPYKAGDMVATAAPEEILTDLRIGGSHWTRDIAFSPDGKVLYVSVGSSGNVADDMGSMPDVKKWEHEHAPGSAWDREEWRANVLTYTPEGKDKKVYAAGIRNCSGLTVQPGTGTVFCATNERDLLGDNTPPDYVTSVKETGFYGWPWYYIGSHEDTRPGGGPRPDLKDKAIVPDVLLQPHSAPLGVAFNPGGLFPAEWKGDAFVALHGSWNRSQHTGYKIVRLPVRNGRLTGEYQDFVLGFTAGEQNVWGRPVSVAFAADGSLLFSEDANGVIYRVTYGPASK